MRGAATREGSATLLSGNTGGICDAALRRAAQTTSIRTAGRDRGVHWSTCCTAGGSAHVLNIVSLKL